MVYHFKLLKKTGTEKMLSFDTSIFFWTDSVVVGGGGGGGGGQQNKFYRQSLSLVYAWFLP